MIKRTLIRSTLQLLGLCLLALFLTTTRAQAHDEPCDSQRGNCASHCGTTVTYGVVGSYWDAYHEWGYYWDEELQDWVGYWIAGYSDRYDYIIGPGVESFECVPDVYGGHGICQCAY